MSFTKKQLLPGEVLITLVRQHPIVLFRPVLLTILAAAVCGALSYYVRPWFLLFLLVPLAYLFWEIAVRQGREYIVTDHRVVKQEGVFSISSFDASLDKINNVFHQQSLWGRIFKYGTVGLETASEQGTTVFEHIPRPVDFKNCVVRQRESYRRATPVTGPDVTQDVPRLLTELASLRDRNIISNEEYELKKKSLLDRI